MYCVLDEACVYVLGVACVLCTGCSVYCVLGVACVLCTGCSVYCVLGVACSVY